MQGAGPVEPEGADDSVTFLAMSLFDMGSSPALCFSWHFAA